MMTHRDHAKMAIGAWIVSLVGIYVILNHIVAWWPT